MLNIIFFAIFLFFINEKSLDLADKLVVQNKINNKSLAIKIYKLNCDLDNAKACYSLALQYFDKEKLLLKSCKLGYANACSKLAYDYYILDFNKNREFYKYSCELGNDSDCIISFDENNIDYERLIKYCKLNKGKTCKYLRDLAIENNNLEHFIISCSKEYQKLYKQCNDKNAKSCYELGNYLKDLVFKKDLYDKACRLGESRACDEY